MHPDELEENGHVRLQFLVSSFHSEHGCLVYTDILNLFPFEILGHSELRSFETP